MKKRVRIKSSVTAALCLHISNVRIFYSSHWGIVQNQQLVCGEIGADLFKPPVNLAVRWILSLFQLSFTAPTSISSFQRMCESEPVDSAGSSLDATQNTIVRYCFSVKAKLLFLPRSGPDWLTVSILLKCVSKDMICGYCCGCNQSHGTK